MYQFCVCDKSFILKKKLLQHYMETVEVEYTVYTAWKKKIISHKKISVFYNEVCENKLIDCHHSDNALYMCTCV